MSTGLYDVLSLQGLTFPSSNVTSEATAGFEVKDGRNTAFVHLTDALYDTEVLLSLALGFDSKTITAAQAKTLPGVTEETALRIFCELFTDSLEDGRTTAVEVAFFDESGTEVGDTTAVEVTTAEVWQAVSKRVEVPTGATRINFYLRAFCEAGDTVQAWIANLKIVSVG